MMEKQVVCLLYGLPKPPGDILPVGLPKLERPPCKQAFAPGWSSSITWSNPLPDRCAP
jgi:hypothetical protein